MSALHPQLHPKPIGDAVEGDTDAQTRNACIFDEEIQRGLSPTPPHCPPAHPTAENARPLVPENDTDILVSAPGFAPAFDLLHTIVGNGHRASRYARMNAPGAIDENGEP